MVIHQCDACEKLIEDDEGVEACTYNPYRAYKLCSQCGEGILSVIEKIDKGRGEAASSKQHSNGL
jgi:hypothetical protein